MSAASEGLQNRKNTIHQIFALSKEKRAQKKSTKIKFLGPETARGGGGRPREGVVAETSCPPSKLCLPWVSKREIRDVPGILPGCPGPLAVFKKFVQKNFVRIFRSLNLEVRTGTGNILPANLRKEKGT